MTKLSVEAMKLIKSDSVSNKVLCVALVDAAGEITKLQSRIDELEDEVVGRDITLRRERSRIAELEELLKENAPSSHDYSCNLKHIQSKYKAEAHLQECECLFGRTFRALSK